MSTLVASFRFNARGMSLTEPVESVTDQHHIVLSVVDPNGPELRLVVTLGASSEMLGLERAQTIADAVYERMLLDLAPYVAGSARPLREKHTFTDLTGGSTPGGATIVGLSLGMVVAIAEGVASLDPVLVKPSLDRALLGVEVGQPAIAAMVYSARAMYRVAMQTNDPVASYLICYSALHLAALFKRGPHATQQRNVDDLLMAEDARVQRLPVPQHDGSIKHETPFTTCRNRFVHAEGRGADPEGAAREMSDRLPAFVTSPHASYVVSDHAAFRPCGRAMRRSTRSWVRGAPSGPGAAAQGRARVGRCP
jgi:hypothetical protein